VPALCLFHYPPSKVVLEGYFYFLVLSTQ